MPTETAPKKPRKRRNYATERAMTVNYLRAGIAMITDMKLDSEGMHGRLSAFKDVLRRLGETENE